MTGVAWKLGDDDSTALVAKQTGLSMDVLNKMADNVCCSVVDWEHYRYGRKGLLRNLHPMEPAKLDEFNSRVVEPCA